MPHILYTRPSLVEDWCSPTIKFCVMFKLANLIEIDTYIAFSSQRNSVRTSAAYQSSQYSAAGIIHVSDTQEWRSKKSKTRKKNTKVWFVIECVVDAFVTKQCDNCQESSTDFVWLTFCVNSSFENFDTFEFKPQTVCFSLLLPTATFLVSFIMRFVSVSHQAIQGCFTLLKVT